MTLGLPTQGQPANIGPNTEQIPRQREPEADPSFGNSLGQWVRVKAQCPMVRSWSGRSSPLKGEEMEFPPTLLSSPSWAQDSTGLCSSSDPSLGASATKRKKKKGPIFKEHHCWAYLLLKRAVLEKAKYSLVGWGADFPFLQHSKLSLSLLTEEKLFIFQSEGKPWDRSAPCRPHGQRRWRRRENNVVYCERENRWGQRHPRDTKIYIFM